MPEIHYVSLNEEDYMPNAQKRKRGNQTFGPFPMRTFGQRLFYSTGLAYLSGLTYGGIYGTWRGLMTAKIPNFKVRMNSVLNQVSRYGTWSGNSLAVMVMQFSIIDGFYSSLRNGESDYYNHVGAAFTSGLIFKSTAGLRPALLMGSMLGTAVGLFGLVDNFILNRNLKQQGKAAAN